MTKKTNSITNSIQNYEALRLEDLYSLNITNVKNEARFDKFTHLIANFFSAPIVQISLVHVKYQWNLSTVGLKHFKIPRKSSFCAHAILQNEILVVSDAINDETFSNNPLVKNPPNIRFYAGAVLRGPKGYPVGILCIMDTIPRKLKKKYQTLLIQFARLLEHELRYKYYPNAEQSEIANSLYYEQTTGLPSRYLFKERLAQAIETLKENMNTNKNILVVWLVIAQLCELKNAFNPEILKPALIKLVHQIQQVLKKSEIVSYGGDSSFLLFVFCDSNEFSSRIKKILDTSTFQLDVNNQKTPLSSMAGISIYPLDSTEPDELINNAKYAVHLLNNQKNIPYRFYADKMTRQSSRDYKLELLLSKALEEKTIEVAYQPKINLSTGYICGAEALCRWSDPKHGPISPSKFIPLAERSDLIISLGSFVLQQACFQNQQWQAQDFRKFPISVNISKKQFTEINLVKHIQQILEESKLKSQYLNLELTESVLMNDVNILEVMKACNKIGINFSLDDFGTGFSSLSYLKIYPFNQLKIDVSFIRNMNSNETDKQLVRAVISMAKALNIKCVAEGVEKQEQLDLLRTLGCDEVQGYIISPPLSPDSFTQLLREDRTLPT